MRLIQNLLFALAVSGLTATASASPAAPTDGAEYRTLPEAQNTDSANKIEVTEFFSYNCPHCNVFEPVLAAWVKKNADKVVLKRVHVALLSGDIALQRTYLTLETMGLAEQNHQKLFDAVHKERMRISDDESAFAWATKAGLNRDKFISTFRSFGLQAKVNRSQALTRSYKVDSWPMVAIDGRYLTSPYVAGSTSPGMDEPQQQQAALQVMDFLIAKVKAEKK
ncbi:MAG: thiol:disulfide interchange protein DsbA/DsbL [Pseudomonadota bacterium]